MKQKMLFFWALTVAAMPFAVRGDDSTVTPPVAPPPPPVAETAPPASPPPAADTAPPPAPAPAPPLSSPAREIAKLAGSGVPDEVVKAYIENSSSTFNLTPDGVIYMQGQHVSGAVTAAMLLHDKSLREQVNNLPPMPPAPPYPPVAGPPVADDYPQPTVQVAYIPNRDYNPYGGWQYGADYGWYWQPNSWAGYPWGLVGFNTGRWWNHPRRGLVWSPGAQFRGRGAGNQPVVIGQPAPAVRAGVHNFTTGRIQFTTGGSHQ